MQGIAVAGGHTEYSDRYDRAVVMGAIIGMADKIMKAEDIKQGDILIATKHIGIEGMSILASDRPDLLSDFMTEQEIKEIAAWSDHTSVLAESRVVREYAKFMHDPTDGGFLGGIAEISSLCGLKAELDFDSVPLHPLTKRAAEKLGFDALHLIASGSMLIVTGAENAQNALNALKNAGIAACVVGKIGGTLTEPVEDPVEELWGLLKREKKQ